VSNNSDIPSISISTDHQKTKNQM